jgi:hypothetical protein
MTMLARPPLTEQPSPWLVASADVPLTPPHHHRRLLRPRRIKAAEQNSVADAGTPTPHCANPTAKSNPEPVGSGRRSRESPAARESAEADSSTRPEISPGRRRPVAAGAAGSRRNRRRSVAAAANAPVLLTAGQCRWRPPR